MIIIKTRKCNEENEKKKQKLGKRAYDYFFFFFVARDFLMPQEVH